MKKDDKKRLFEVMGRLDKTFKPKLNKSVDDAVIGAEEKPEEKEGVSYKAKLEELVNMAKKACEELPEDELPSWVQDKIVIAKEHLNDILGWIHGEEEEKEGEEMGSNREMDSDEEQAEEPEINDEPENDEKTEIEVAEAKKPKVPVAAVAKVGK